MPQKNDHRQCFQENTSTISKNPIPTSQATISLTQPNPRIDYSPFSHLQSFTQPIPVDQMHHNLFSVPPQSIQSPMMIPLQSPLSQQMKWNSSMSTFQYELVLLPDSVRKCYGYSQRFNDCYRHYPKNFIIWHKDGRIMGKSIFGDLTYSSDFQFTYYHLSRDHAVRKSPNFRNNPYVYAPPKAFTHFNNDLELKAMICNAGFSTLQPVRHFENNLTFFFQHYLCFTFSCLVNLGRTID